MATTGEKPTRHPPQVAANPIPYWARDGRVDKSRDVFEEAFADLCRHRVHGRQG